MPFPPGTEEEAEALRCQRPVLGQWQDSHRSCRRPGLCFPVWTVSTPQGCSGTHVLPKCRGVSSEPRWPHHTGWPGCGLAGGGAGGSGSLAVYFGGSAARVPSWWRWGRLCGIWRTAPGAARGGGWRVTSMFCWAWALSSSSGLCAQDAFVDTLYFPAFREAPEYDPLWEVSQTPPSSPSPHLLLRGRGHRHGGGL